VIHSDLASQARSEVAGPRVLPGSAWQCVVICVFLLAATFALLWPTTASLIVAWEDTSLATYTHGYMIVALSFWLLWRDRHRLGAIPATFTPFAAVPLAAVSLLWLICVRAGIQTAHQFLLPIIVWLAICTVLGWRVAVASTFAVGYLYFAVRIWGVINGVLQDATVFAADALLRATGVTAYVEGNLVHLAAGTFEIAGGCSGLHFFIVAFAISALYGEVYRDSWWARLRIVGLALLLAVLTNWVRVYTIILAGDLTDMQHYLVRVEHYRYGWALFAVMMVIFFLIVRRLPASPQGHRELESAGSVGLPSRWPLAVTTSLAAIALGPLWGVLSPVSAATLPQGSALLPSAAVASGSQGAHPSWKPIFRGVDAEHRGYYERGGMRIDGYVAAYASQRQGKELVNDGNSIVGADASIASSRRIEPRGPANELIVQDSAGQQFVLWYFYRIGPLQTDSSLVAQVAYGLRSLTGSPMSTLVALRAPCAPDCDAARASLQGLIDSVEL
jgi:exosortase A